MLYFIKEGLFKCGLYLQGGLYLEVAFNTGLTVFLNNSSGNLFHNKSLETAAENYLLWNYKHCGYRELCSWQKSQIHRLTLPY